MIAYKLFKQRKDGSIGPLFINSSQRIPVGEWLDAEAHKTNGYKFRMGWHCCKLAFAPHLKMNPASRLPRVWGKVEVADFEWERRPESQGGLWILAQRMKLIEIIG